MRAKTQRTNWWRARQLAFGMSAACAVFALQSLMGSG